MTRKVRVTRPGTSMLATTVIKRIAFIVVGCLIGITAYLVVWYYTAKNAAATDVRVSAIAEESTLVELSNFHFDGFSKSFVIEWYFEFPRSGFVYVNTYTPFGLFWMSCNEVQYKKRIILITR